MVKSNVQKTPYFLIQLILLVGTLLLTACPSKKSSHRKDFSKYEPQLPASIAQGPLGLIKPETKVVSLGDPKGLIAGTVRNPTVPDGFFVKGESVYLYMNYSITELTEYDPNEEVSTEANQEDQAPAEANEIRRRQSLVVEMKVEQTEPTIILKVDDQETPISFEIRNDTNTFVGEAPALDVKAATTQILHASVTPTHSHLSLLLSNETPEDGQTLIGYYFMKSPKFEAPEQINTSYNYMLGPGLPAGWPKKEKVKLDICGEGAEKEKDLISDLAKQWQKPLEGLLNIEVSVAPIAKPFTDLNQHCIYVVDGVASFANPEKLGLGFSLTQIDYERAEYIDSDIFMLKKELEKIAQAPKELITREFAAALLHEMGHFFGLDHVFDGHTASIMSYDDNDPLLTEYDIAAIRALYSKDEDQAESIDADSAHSHEE